MLENVKTFFMDMLNLLRGREDVREAVGLGGGMSADMYEAIRLCNGIMTHSAPWNERAESCGIPDQVAGELAETVMQEIGVGVSNPAIQGVMEHLNAHVGQLVQYIALLGSCLVRPLYANGKLQYEVLPLGRYLPEEYDFDGTLLSFVGMKDIERNGRRWLLVERHEYRDKNHSVRCLLYRVEGGALRAVPVTDCPQTEDITPEYTWRNAPRPMAVEFRSHVTNRIDGSNVPVALIWGARNLIKDADEQYARMKWEQEAGKKRIFADRDLFERRQSRNGDEVVTRLEPVLKDLVVKIDGDGSGDGSRIKDWSPDLRTDAQNAFLQQIFRRVEMTLNVGKGTISDMAEVQQTATQYMGGKKAYYSIVDTVEDEVEQKYQACADVFAHMAAAYGLGPNDARVSVLWNDALRKDPQQERLTAQQEVSAGLLAPWEYRMRFYGEDEATARRMAEEARPVQGGFIL